MLHFRFRPAQSGDRIGMHRLRYRVYHDEREWIPSNPHRIESDIWDIVSDHFVAVTQTTGDVVGTARMIYDSELRFPYEHAAPLPEWLDQTRTYEVSRLAAAPDVRDGKSLVLIGLCRRIWERGHELQMTHWCAVVDRPVAALLRRIGFEFCHRGETVFHLGSDCIPIVCDMRQSKEVLFADDINERLALEIEEREQRILMVCA